MKKKRRVYLAAIRRELQARYKYESREKRNHAFAVLYHGWRQQGVRHGRNYQFYKESWRRGWMSVYDAVSLCEYIGLT